MNYITISCLGKMGRFGNQLFQYAFAKAYAEKHNCILQTPKWIGQKLFNLNDPIIDRQLPVYNCLHRNPTDEVNIDLYGYFQNTDSLSLMSKKWLQSLYKFNDIIEERFSNSKYYIAGHLRRGDYLRLKNILCVVSEKSIYTACEKYGLDKTKLVLIEESKSIKDSYFDSDMQFIPDFMRLKNADVLLRSNSSFSWWAGALSNGIIYSPVVSDKIGFQDIEYVLGNYPLLVHSKYVETKNQTDLHLKDI